MMEEMMQAVRNWTKKIIKNKIRDFAENELRVFRVTANKMEAVKDIVSCGRYGNQNLEVTHVYITDEKQEFRNSDILIINIPDYIHPNYAMVANPILFHINGKEYLTTTDWIDVRSYEGRKTNTLKAERIYESKSLQNIEVNKTQSITISLKKAVYIEETYEYATVLDNVAPTGGGRFSYSVAANYGDFEFLRNNFTTYGLQTIEHGSFTNGTIGIELDGLSSAYLLFTQERKVSDNTVYGYRARMYVEQPDNKAPVAIDLAKSQYAGVTLGTVLGGASVNEETFYSPGITLKATNVYEVKYVLYKIRGAS